MQTTPPDTDTEPDTEPDPGEASGADPAPPLEWDYARMFGAFGGAVGLRDALHAEGWAAPRPHAIWMWRVRNRVPHAWLPAVLAILTDTHGTPLRELLRPAEPRPEPG